MSESKPRFRIERDSVIVSQRSVVCNYIVWRQEPDEFVSLGKFKCSYYLGSDGEEKVSVKFVPVFVGLTPDEKISLKKEEDELKKSFDCVGYPFVKLYQATGNYKYVGGVSDERIQNCNPE